MDGEVIGINSAIVSAAAATTASASPSHQLAKSVAEMLIKDGKVHYARIGIKLSPLTPPSPVSWAWKTGPRACWSVRSSPGSPAEKAGLKQGDVITSFAGEKVQDSRRSGSRWPPARSPSPMGVGYLREAARRPRPSSRPRPRRSSSIWRRKASRASRAESQRT